MANKLFVMWLAILGVTFYNFAPFLVGAVIELPTITEAQGGWIASANMLGLCLALVLAATLIRAWPQARVALIGLIGMSVGNILSGLGEGIGALLFSRTLTGLGEGFVIATAIRSIKGFENPDRIFALMMAGMSIYGMLGLLMLPSIIRNVGIHTTFMLLAALPLITLLFLKWAPLPESRTEEIVVRKNVIPTTGIFLLVSIFLVYVGTNGVWAYYERIGASSSIAAGDIGVALSAALFASLLGSILAAAISTRYGRQLPILGGLAICASSALFLLGDINLVQYSTSAILLFGGTGFMRVNLTRFHGVFSPRSRLRVYVVPGKPEDESKENSQSAKGCHWLAMAT